MPAYNVLWSQSADAPTENFFAITPDNNTNFAFNTRGIYVGNPGNIVAVRLDGTAVTFTNAQAGTVIPIVCMRVNSTNTTATSLVGLC